MSTEASAIEINPYSPPASRVADAPAAVDEALYVVAPGKFLVMAIGTACVYLLYWFYKNWALLNRKHQAYWPVPRAIFSVFFTHSLFEEIDGRVRRTGLLYAWSPSAMATIYVVCALIRGVSTRVGANVFPPGWMMMINLGLMIPMVYALYRAQRAINVAESDPEGNRNRAFTAANVCWLVLGALWWLVIGVGIFALMSGRVKAL